MNIIFMGTPDFAVASLHSLLESAHKAVAVVTVPDKPKGRGQMMQPSPVKKTAMAAGIPVLQPEKLSDPDFIDQLRQYNADCFVVVAFRILPRSVFSIPKRGTVNVHASLLPKYRGAAPINWAIINGEKESGVTTMMIDDRVDTGGTLMQEKVPIAPDMTAGELHDALAVTGAKLLISTLEGIENETLTPFPQDEALATRAPKITKEFCHINFDQPAGKVHDFIRGLSPYPGAYASLDGKLLKILQTELAEGKNPHSQTGRVESVFKDHFTVTCATGSLRVMSVQLQGKRRMDCVSFLNGYTLSEGVILK